MEHAIALFFALGFPAITTPVYARRRPALLAGDRALKRREYRETIAWLSAMGIASVTYFAVTERDMALLGVSWPRGRLGAVSVVIAIAIVGLLWLQLRAVQRDAATRAAVKEGFESVREFVPVDRAELPLFRGVSFSAGIGEELFYRGFLMWYVGLWLPLWVAVVVSTLLFGLAHVAHGAQATIRATLSGAGLAALYLLGGSLVAPIIVHTAIDLTSGQMAAVAFSGDTTDPGDPA